MNTSQLGPNAPQRGLDTSQHGLDVSQCSPVFVNGSPGVCLGCAVGALQIPRPLARKILLLPPPADDGASLRVDFRHPLFVTFINDIEKDSEYKTWKTNMQQVRCSTVFLALPASMYLLCI